MRKFMLAPGAEGKWMHQNEAVWVDGFEGCLVDNELYECKRGFCAAYEKALNEWSSTKVYVFVPYKDEGARRELLDEFDRRKGEVESCVNGEAA